MIIMWRILSLLFFWSLSITSYAGTPPSNLPNLELPAIIAPDALTNKQPVLPDKTLTPFPEQPEFKLPKLDVKPEDNQQLSTQYSLFVKKIIIIGNTVFADSQLKTITSQYENRTVTNRQLQTLRYQLTRYYIDHGYINSGVMLPDQEISNGVVRLQAIEGKLSEITVSGNTWLRTSYIKKRIKQHLAPVLNINKAQENILLLQQDPLIDRINAALSPGTKLGESRLNVAVVEAKPYQAGVIAANDRSPSLGHISGKVWVRHNNLTGFGDGLFFSYTGMEGLDDFYASYSVPVSAYNTRLNFYHQNSNSDVVGIKLNNVSIKSHSTLYGIALSQPFYRTAKQTLSASLAFEYRRSKTFFNNQPQSFALGVPDKGQNKGVSKIAVLRFSQNWLDRDQTQVIAARSTFNFGINVLGATHHSNGQPDGQFFSWLGQFQWVKRLPILNSQILFHANLQLANDTLLPLEKMSIGGRYSVRGYRENQYVRDNGTSASLEWRFPVFRLPIPGLSKSIADGRVQLATFADFGWAKNTEVKSPAPNTIWSWGLGILWDPSPKLHSELYWGRPFRSIRRGQRTKHDIQDYGIHFQLNIRAL